MSRQILIWSKNFRILDQIHRRDDDKSYEAQIMFVEAPPGQDQRYAIDASKIKNKLGWEPEENSETRFLQTIQ